MARYWRVWLWTAIGGLSAVLSLLAWKLVEQDRALAVQRETERREPAADRAVAALERRLAEVERTLGSPACPPNGVCVRLRGGRIEVWPPGRLLYQPGFATPPEVQSPALAAAADLEFRAADSRAAIRALQAIPAADARMRAALLARLARNHRKIGDEATARVNFNELIKLGDTPIGGMPAALAGSLGLGEDAMRRELDSRRWAISSAVFRALAPDAPAAPLEEAVERLTESGVGSVAERSAANGVLQIWRASGDQTVAYLTAEAEAWKPAVPAGYAVHFGDASASAAIRLASATGLPWTLQITGAGDQTQRREWMAAAALGVLLALIAAAGWAIDRAVRHQLALAADQSNFVSAVSHEFRTPLTTLKQLTELLLQGRVATEADRLEYYRLLDAESDRLRRVVEGMLTFGRLDAGRAVLQFEPIDAGLIVAECAREAKAHHPGFEFDVAIETSKPARADRDALRIAIGNLVENAVKYSPGGAKVWVSVVDQGRDVGVAVHDEGIGIPRHEQRRVFDKFVRGEEARRLGLRGTGVGLATVKQLALYHGGSVAVESEPDKGSTFTLRLPKWGNG
ncbi:MAG: HAMP domain-containing histidine kinase [Acidobacteria bacterium]|nr:HAMP domain-containing histidine kinase [Acidobacteriota bacterium]